MGGTHRDLGVVALAALAAGCSSAPARSPSPRTTERVATTCAQNVATASTHRERGELRAALAALDHVPDRRVLKSLAEATPCPAGAALAEQLRAELGVDVPLEPVDAVESRRLHGAALEAIAVGKHEDAIRDLEAAHAKWPHPQLQVALFRVHALAGHGKQARIAADRAVALAERIGGEPGVVTVRRAHSNWVYEVVYDATGRWLVTANEDELVVWDHATGQPLRRLEGGRTVALLALGDAIVTGSSDGAVRTWDIHRGHIIGKRELAGGLRSMIAAPDGSQLAITDGTHVTVLGPPVNALDRASGPVVWQTASVETLLHYADGGKTLVTAGTHVQGQNEQAIVTLRDAATGRVEKRLRVPAQVEDGGLPNELVNDVAVSGDGKLVAAAGIDRVHVWDRTSGRKLVSFKTRDWPNDVAFVDNARLQIASELFLARTGKKLSGVAACSGAVHPHGGERACPTSSSISHPRGITLHAADGTRRELGHAETMFTPRTLDISPDGKHLTIAHGNEPVVVDLESGRVRAFSRLRGIQAATIANDRRLAVAAGKQVVVLDGSGAQQRTLDFPGWVFTVAFRPDGQALALTLESELVVIDTTSWSELRRQKIGFQVRTIGWSSDGKRLYAHAMQQLGKVYDGESGRELASFLPGMGIGMAHDAKRVAIVRGTPAIIDLEAGTAIEIMAPADRLLGRAMALLPDGTSLLVARVDALAWLDAKAPPRILPFPPGGLADQVLLHPNQRFAIASNSRRHIVIFDLSKAAPVLTLAIGDGGAWAAFDARGRTDGDPALPGLDIAFGKALALPADIDPARRHPGLLAVPGL